VNAIAPVPVVMARISRQLNDVLTTLLQPTL